MLGDGEQRIGIRPGSVFAGERLELPKTSLRLLNGVGCLEWPEQQHAGSAQGRRPVGPTQRDGQVSKAPPDAGLELAVVGSLRQLQRADQVATRLGELAASHGNDG
jgi:hypothetical protein